METYKMYVSVKDQQVYQYPDDSPWEYAVEIPRAYIPIFSRLFEQMNQLEFRNFFRSHLPYIPYHYDRDNHEIDKRSAKVYALIHEFTDEESKRVIEKLPYFH
ncbi:transposase [Sporosarcina sp. HYO08]|uniref:transposase n=1 Tax=Sporosarcina sp. HYO08 TaxID=1759557 RepID=UPI000799A0B2|nr:transposase [Sporosarcina sp. HYO08]KXH86902.1 transposase [Sporosarcina sp. HYO08]